MLTAQMGFGTQADLLQVYPNPIMQGKTISLDLDYAHFKSDVDIYITDVIGNIVYTESITKSYLDQTIFIDTDLLSVGIYFVRISDKDTELTKKLIVQ